jgi:hypothetical protein
MAPAEVWSLDRAAEPVLDAERLRLLAVVAVLAANFALVMLPPAVAALALLGALR